MKRKMKMLRYTTIFLAAVAVGLMIAEAVQKDATAADVIRETDKFIEAHTWQKVEPETVALSYEEYRANESIDHTIDSGDRIGSNGPAYDEPAMTTEYTNTPTGYTNTPTTPEEFQAAGIIDWNGWRFTWYSEQVLPGGGLLIPGRWSDGDFVRDENGYLCVACNDLEHGAVVVTPFGDAVVYDAIGDGVTGIIDIYVSW